MVRTQIQLTEEQSLQLKRIARAKYVSVVELIRHGVDQFLETQVDPSTKSVSSRRLGSSANTPAARMIPASIMIIIWRRIVLRSKSGGVCRYLYAGPEDPPLHEYGGE